jgi:predicted dinucleotide-binding enzyme
MKKVGILGSGIVGQTLGSGFIRHGYEVMLGTRDARKLEPWKHSSGGQTGTFSEAAAFGEILVLAVAGIAAQEVLRMAGAQNLDGKVIIDTTNPIAKAAPQNGVLKYFTTLDNALMEQLQVAYPAARFVKSFSQVGNAFMVNPDFNGERPTMFICGNDEDAKQEVATILDLFGHDVCDVGGMEGARAIEPLCILWCIPGMLRNEWSHAFRLLRK